MSQITAAFPAQLKAWRQYRRLSQLELASHSGISQRHISFLETGRSNPSRAMVIALCESLDVPLRERNSLLAGAGFAPVYRDEALDHDSLQFFRETLATVIAHHEPYPALVLDGRWNVVMANRAAVAFFGMFMDAAALVGDGSQHFRIIRTCLEQDGLKPALVNWHELVYALLQRCRRALSVNPGDSDLQALIDDITGHKDAPADWLRPDTAGVAPVLDMILEKDGRQYALFTMLAHFGAPEHVTLQELSVETFYPADTATRRLFEEFRPGNVAPGN
jgi:transcriptional regulator with XRE-family HTH domain